MNRVVITGMGAISAIGSSAAELWEAAKAGKNGISRIERLDTSGFKATLAGEVKDFDPGAFMEKKEARRMDLYCQYALAAAVQAVSHSGLDAAGLDPWRVGVIVGSGVGGLSTLETEHSKLVEKGPLKVSPLFIPMMISNMAAGMISMRFGFRGPCQCVVTACATSTNTIGDAFRAIKHGYLDACVAGGAEATIVPMALAGFANMTALSQSGDPEAASIPFDRRREGFVMGEGAGIVVLESYDSAKARGAEILGEVAGYGTTGDAYHITSPDPGGEGAAMAMRLAMMEAGLSPEEVGYINAHGTGTPLNDKYETVAIKKAFGDAAGGVLVSSTKSMTGHMLGAAGGIEAIITAQALKEGIVPPTIGLLEQDPECDLDCVPLKARKADISAALSNSFGFGGHNASLLLKKV